MDEKYDPLAEVTIVPWGLSSRVLGKVLAVTDEINASRCEYYRAPDSKVDAQSR